MYDQPTAWTALNALSKSDGRHRAVVETRVEERLFRFCIEEYFDPAPDDEGQWRDGFWSPCSISGLYDSAEEAMSAATDELERWA
jgi:hypothetical protein